MKNREFSKFGLQHIYQRAVDKGVIFYTPEDRLVYYTVAGSAAKKYGVRVYAAAIMFTHTHQVVQAESGVILGSYLQTADSVFARLYNKRYHRRGRLFDKPTGRAQKLSQKSKKSTVIYVFDNHVEKKLCLRAIEQRWSLLCYGASSHPFSPQIDSRTASKRLKRALKLVDRRVSKCKCLEYCDLDSILSELDTVESEQFIDYVISKYAWIDFSLSSRLFDGFDKLVMAADSMTGGEYELNEDYTGASDLPYCDMIKLTGAGCQLESAYSLSEDKKMALFDRIHRELYPPVSMISKFLHMAIKVG